jgi:YbgC/YbaW family acyl-CoA thioester hydrolase
MPTAEIRRRIRWADADAAGRLYFPRLFDYVGEAESELLRSRGLSPRHVAPGYDFPRVHVACQFRKVLALDDPFVLRITVARLGRSSIQYRFQVLRDAGAGEEIAAEGEMTVVVVRGGHPAEIPEAYRRALGTE